MLCGSFSLVGLGKREGVEEGGIYGKGGGECGKVFFMIQDS